MLSANIYNFYAISINSQTKHLEILPSVTGRAGKGGGEDTLSFTAKMQQGGQGSLPWNFG